MFFLIHTAISKVWCFPYRHSLTAVECVDGGHSVLMTRELDKGAACLWLGWQGQFGNLGAWVVSFQKFKGVGCGDVGCSKGD